MTLLLSPAMYCPDFTLRFGCNTIFKSILNNDESPCRLITNGTLWHIKFIENRFKERNLREESSILKERGKEYKKPMIIKNYCESEGYILSCIKTINKILHC